MGGTDQDCLCTSVGWFSRCIPFPRNADLASAKCVDAEPRALVVLTESEPAMKPVGSTRRGESAGAVPEGRIHGGASREYHRWAAVSIFGAGARGQNWADRGEGWACGGQGWQQLLPPNSNPPPDSGDSTQVPSALGSLKRGHRTEESHSG